MIAQINVGFMVTMFFLYPVPTVLIPHCTFESDAVIMTYRFCVKLPSDASANLRFQIILLFDLNEPNYFLNSDTCICMNFLIY